MDIAISGTTGFIGSHLSYKLSNTKDCIVHHFNRNYHSLFSTKSLQKFVEDKDVIIHLAGEVSTNKHANYYRVNTIGTLNLLEAVSLYGKRDVQFIFSSTSLASQTEPDNHYTLSKLFAEKLIKFHSKKNCVRGCILRLANVYGPGARTKNNSVIVQFLKNAQENKPIIVNGTGQQKRNFIYIDDVVNAITIIMGNQKENLLLLNVCSRESISINDLVKQLEEVLKRKLATKYTKSHQEESCAIAFDKREWEKFDYEPKFDLNAGLTRTIKYNS